eukprot:jgi/Mesen1/8375/ME000468S07813
MVRATHRSWWPASRFVLVIVLILVLGSRSVNTGEQRNGGRKRLSLPRSLRFTSFIENQWSTVGGGSRTGGRRSREKVGETLEEVPKFGAHRRLLDTSNSTNGTGLGYIHEDDETCTGVRRHVGFKDTCAFVRAKDGCRQDSLLNYLQFFFCYCQRVHVLGFIVLGAWLLALFFMLGNTAADYFCPSLEEISEILHLPPTLAGVTLLPLGNGAPDVFARRKQDIISTLLLLVWRALAPTRFEAEAGALLGFLLVGHVHLAWALAYLSIYALYGVSVGVSECTRRGASFPAPKVEWLLQPLQVVSMTLPQWTWTQTIYAQHCMHLHHHQHHQQEEGPTLGPRSASDGGQRPLWGWSEDEEEPEKKLYPWYALRSLLDRFVKFPLMLPRRLTIPNCQPSSWSKGYGVASAALAPLLFAFVISGESHTWQAYAAAAAAGAALGGAACLLTDADEAPRRGALAWLLGGFVMSVCWFYLIANELVAVLVSLGVILEIDSALLGLTVLAWGNSIGDAVANLAMASNGRPEGVQISWSGCYASPMFNVLIGLGMSFVLASWSAFPAAFQIPHDPTLPWTIGFLVIVLLYSLVVLPLSDMRLTRTLGVGLLLLYGAFMCLRFLLIIGVISM